MKTKYDEIEKMEALIGFFNGYNRHTGKEELYNPHKNRLVDSAAKIFVSVANGSKLEISDETEIEELLNLGIIRPYLG